MSPLSQTSACQAQDHMPDQSIGTKAAKNHQHEDLQDASYGLTNCIASAFLKTSDGTPLNCRNGVMEPHLQGACFETSRRRD